MNVNVVPKFFAVLVSLIFLSGCLGDPTERSTNNYLDDKVVAARLSQKLKSGAGDNLQNVSVVVSNGVVHLSGFVKSEEQKSRAEEIAREGNANAKVHNEITVKP